MILHSTRHRAWALAVCLIAAPLGSSFAQTTAAPAAPPPAAQQNLLNEREKWLPDLISALKVGEGSRVADVGAGPGFFSVRLARVVGARGHVFAVDINPRVIERLRDRAEKEQLPSLEALLGDPDDPKLPADGVDAVLIVNAYHEMEQHQAILTHVREAIRPGGRLVIAEPSSATMEGYERARQTNTHEIAIRYVEDDLAAAGFTIVERRPRFQDGMGGGGQYYWLLVAERPAR